MRGEDRRHGDLLGQGPGLMPGGADVAGTTFYTCEGGRGRVWQVCWDGWVLPLSWREQEPAEALLVLLRRTQPGLHGEGTPWRSAAESPSRPVA